MSSSVRAVGLAGAYALIQLVRFVLLPLTVAEGSGTAEVADDPLD